MLIWATYCNLEFQNHRFLGAIVVILGRIRTYLFVVYLLRAHSPIYSPNPFHLLHWQPSEYSPPRIGEPGSLYAHVSPPLTLLYTWLHLKSHLAALRTCWGIESAVNLHAAYHVNEHNPKVYLRAEDSAGECTLWIYFPWAPQGPEIVLYLTITFWWVVLVF